MTESVDDGPKTIKKKTWGIGGESLEGIFECGDGGECHGHV